MGLRHNPITYPLVEPTRHRVSEQRTRVILAEARERHVRQVGKQPVCSGLSDREDQHHRFGQEAPAHESEHLRRRLVEPLRIIDQTHQWFVAGRFREQAQSTRDR